MVERDVLRTAQQRSPSSDSGVRRAARAARSTPRAEASPTGAQAALARQRALDAESEPDALALSLRRAVAQRTADGPILQRAVGFEFETGWGVRRTHTSRFRHKRKPIKKATVLHAYPGFNLTSDEAKGGVGAALEWVVDPPVEEGPRGRHQLDAIMTQLVAEAAKLEALHAVTFTLDQATGDPADAWLEILPTVVAAKAGPGMPANPQVTAGVRLAQMQTMFAELGSPSGADKDIKATLAQWGPGALAAAAREAAKIDGSDELKGLVAQLVAYLNTGSWAQMQRTPNKAFEYAKLIGNVMARTDFATQFDELPEDEHTRFRTDPQDFIDLVLETSDDPTPDARVFERGVRKDFRKLPTKQSHVRAFGPTRAQWLRGITQGTDMLSSAHMPKWKPTLEGLGGLGGRFDTLGEGERGMIVEFRGVQKEMKLDTWRDFALAAYDYIVDLNARPSPAESAQPEESESESDLATVSL